MRVIEDFKMVRAPYASDSPCVLWHHGQRSPLLVGDYLKAVVECGQRYLVFLIKDMYDISRLEIYLLDAQLIPIDHAMIGFNDFLHFYNFKFLNDNQLSFCCPTEDTVWRLTLWAAPRRRCTLLSGSFFMFGNVAYAGRPFGLRQHHHFALERISGS
jgi:hypothetical protein